MKLTDILNEIKARPATQPKVDSDKVLEYYIEDLKNHLRSRTDGSKMWRLAKRPQVFDPKNYKLINYTEHFNSSYSGLPHDYIAYYFKYKFTGEIIVVVLHKGRPGQADDNLQISDDYWYYRFTDVDNFNRRINEIKARRPQQSLLELIQNNINFIEDALSLYESRNIHWITKNPQEVAMKSFWDIGDAIYRNWGNEIKTDVFFKFLGDAQSDPFYMDEDYDGEFRTILIDGVEIAYRFIVKL
jgi:hypothetical protein